MKASRILTDEQCMREALREARAAAAEGEVPIGAVVVCGDRIIARAHNYTERLTDVTAHAEMQLIGMAADYLGGKYLNDCTLYVTVEPCPMCAAALAWAQLGRLVYAAPDPKRGYTLFTPSLLHPRTEVTSGLLAPEASVLMTEFFKKQRERVGGRSPLQRTAGGRYFCSNCSNTQNIRAAKVLRPGGAGFGAEPQQH